MSEERKLSDSEILELILEQQQKTQEHLKKLQKDFEELQRDYEQILIKQTNSLDAEVKKLREHDDIKLLKHILEKVADSAIAADRGMGIESVKNSLKDILEDYYLEEFTTSHRLFPKTFDGKLCFTTSEDVIPTGDKNLDRNIIEVITPGYIQNGFAVKKAEVKIYKYDPTLAATLVEENSVETAENVVETTENIVEIDENVVETAENVVETAENAETTENVVENAETPVPNETQFEKINE
jgi:molecular chaperone GrpE (heat shock protein)